MIRKVFAPLEGERGDENDILVGIEEAQKVLSVLERFAQEGLVLNGKSLSLADCHLAPMIDYFTQAKEGQEAMLMYHCLQRWWDNILSRGILKATDPNLFAVQVN